ncbi:S1 family peptidase [Streptomyces sp. NA04227]|uniref:S1 family peptidase n=1 Tax=Streptomyces sp. NA04227 TaxID=2742136 RepID=UPI0020CA2EC7|nr:S1 family peptidase [Streptomyces sp. NA04227]
MSRANRELRESRRSSLRRLSLVGASAAAVLSATVALPHAHAAPAPDPLTAAAAGQLAADISARLGPSAAGAYYDPANQRLVVNVLNETAAAQVRAAGAESRIVQHSLASLDAARAALKAKAGLPGTAWAMNPKTNQVQVTVDSTVRGEQLKRLNSVVASLGSRAAVTRTPGEFRPLIAGGDAIWGEQGRCSLGFNVTKGGKPYFLTAGHCTKPIPTWSDKQGGEEVATSENASFPGDDYGLARYTAEVAHPSEVNLYNGSRQAITKAGDATVGQLVRRSGSTTRLHGGSVTAVNATVNYREGRVEGLIQTNVCAEPGDSGGALFEGDTALGLTSGGNGDCMRGGTTFFQPVTEALQKTGTQIG